MSGATAGRDALREAALSGLGVLFDMARAWCAGVGPAEGQVDRKAEAHEAYRALLATLDGLPHTPGEDPCGVWCDERSEHHTCDDKGDDRG